MNNPNLSNLIHPNPLRQGYSTQPEWPTSGTGQSDYYAPPTAPVPIPPSVSGSVTPQAMYSDSFLNEPLLESMMLNMQVAAAAAAANGYVNGNMGGNGFGGNVNGASPMRRGTPGPNQHGRHTPGLKSKHTRSNSDHSGTNDDKKLNLYKTELCRSWEETGTCKYGTKCQFAHSEGELRPVDRHPRYKTEMCKTFWELGTCPYGKRCCFIHTYKDLHKKNDDMKRSLIVLREPSLRERKKTGPSSSTATSPDHQEQFGNELRRPRSTTFSSNGDSVSETSLSSAPSSPMKQQRMIPTSTMPTSTSTAAVPIPEKYPSPPPFDDKSLMNGSLPNLPYTDLDLATTRAIADAYFNGQAHALEKANGFITAPASRTTSPENEFMKPDTMNDLGQFLSRMALEDRVSQQDTRLMEAIIYAQQQAQVQAQAQAQQQSKPLPLPIPRNKAEQNHGHLTPPTTPPSFDAFTLNGTTTSTERSISPVTLSTSPQPPHRRSQSFNTGYFLPPFSPTPTTLSRSQTPPIMNMNMMNMGMIGGMGMPMPVPMGVQRPATNMFGGRNQEDEVAQAEAEAERMVRELEAGEDA